ncbi:MAG: hypothetical protein J6D47_17350 [Peptostreptococcaceae bacterium]|nr:hypothetical protein [Peptostreptococcaceae bacterium]
MGRYIWMAVTTDEYELPIFVADSAKELGECLGCSSITVRTAFTCNYSGRWKKRKIVRVDTYEGGIEND